jgi:quinol monooxygenase YgiN
MSQVVVIASFRVKEGREDDVVAGLTELITQSHGEAGCLSYALHHDRNDPQVYVVIERWTSMVALESHLQQPYVAAIGPLAQDALAEPPVVRFVDPISLGDPVKGTL